MFRKCALVAAALWAALSGSAQALPDRPTTVQGTVQVNNPSANILQILQSSPQAIINWNSFNIGSRETVRFLQPSNVSAVLNRVTGGDPSAILGKLQANGRIFLVNPNGILFGPGSIVDVGSFVASTLSLSDTDFMSGHYNLIQAPDRTLASIVNQGTIKVAEGGFITLVSPLLHNDGLILAQSGQVQLGATTQATFSVDGRGLVQFAVADGFGQPKSTQAPGTVMMTTGQVSTLLTQVVNNPNIIEAGDFQGGIAPHAVAAVRSEGLLLNSGTINVDGAHGRAAGTIGLNSSQATVLAQGGLLSANSSGNAGNIRALSAGTTVSAGDIQGRSTGKGNGGFVEVSAPKINVTKGVDVSSKAGRPGTFLLDPTDITIVDDNNPAGGTTGSIVTTGAINASPVVTLMATNNVTYNTSSGFSATGTDLTVTAGNDIAFVSTGTLGIATHSLNLQAGRNLTLTAAGDIQVQTGTGDLTLHGGNQLNVQTPAGGINLQSNAALRASGASVNVSTGGDIRLAGSNLVDVSATNGSALLLAGHSLTVTSQNDAVNFSAVNGAIGLNSGSNTDLTLRAAATSPITFNASGDVLVNATANLRTSGASLNAHGRDIVVNTNGAPDSALNVNLAADRDVKLASTGSLTVGVNSLNVTATNSLTVVANNNLDIGSTMGNISLVAGQGLSLAAGSGESSLNSAGALTVSGQSVSDTAGGQVLLDAQGPVKVLSTNGSINLNPAQFLRASSHNSGVALNATNGDVALHSGSGSDINLQAAVGSAVSVNATGDVLINASNNVNFSGANATFQGRDITVNATRLLQLADTPLNLAASRNLSVASTGGLNLEARSVNVTATNTLALSANAGDLNVLSSAGNINLQAGQVLNLTAVGGFSNVHSTGSLTVTGQSVRDVADTDVLLDGADAVNIRATNGPLTLQAGHALRARSQNSSTSLSSVNGDIVFATGAGFDQTFTAAAGSPLTISAGNNLNLNPPSTLNLAGSNITLHAGGDLNITVPNLQLTSSNVITSAGRDLTIRGTGSDLAISGLSVNATAGRNLTLGTNQNLVVNASAGDVNLAAGNTLRPQGTVSTTVYATGNVTLSAGQDLALTATPLLTVNATGLNLRADGTAEFPVSVFNTSTGGFNANSSGSFDLTPLDVTSPGPITLNAAHNLTLNQVTGNDVSISGGNVILTSVANISGGNYTITTPGNLTEKVATDTAHAPTLNNLTITAKEAFGVGPSNSFSIPTSSAGNVVVTITGGNDTVFQAAASLFEVGNSRVQLVTTPTTGAVLVQGVTVFNGTNPPPPPPPPPPSNPTNGNSGNSGAQNLASRNISSARVALAALSPPAQVQVLQQIGRSQAVLTQSASLDDDLSTRPLSVQDSSLRNTSPNSQPISPTLALVAGACAEMDLRQDLAWYNAVFAASYEEMREKDRVSFNVMVDQEVREIWEVRYWRRLIEGFIVWEDN